VTSTPSIDGVLVQWGERLFYPKNRIVNSQTPRLRSVGQRASAIRSRIEATVRRAPQVMVKVTGGGRGMAAIAAHFRYISKNGRLPFEDDRGVVEHGKDALKEIERQWRFGGAQIDDVGYRREAFNIMLSMPRGTDPLVVLRAAREFAKIELADHRYVMVLHDHQANPHVHPQCQGGVEARSATQSPQGGSAYALAGDIRRGAARAGDRRGGQPAGGEGCLPQSGAAVAGEGRGGGAATGLATQGQGRDDGEGQS
jgi:hypothetical protein